jgi:hypothetical protein
MQDIQQFAQHISGGRSINDIIDAAYEEYTIAPPPIPASFLPVHRCIHDELFNRAPHQN